MANVAETGRAVVEFLKDTLNVEQVKVIKVVKADGGWQTQAEVYEDNSFLKSVGLPTKVQDRNVYSVRLNDGLQVESYERQDHPVLTD